MAKKPKRKRIVSTKVPVTVWARQGEIPGVEVKVSVMLDGREVVVTKFGVFWAKAVEFFNHYEDSKLLEVRGKQEMARFVLPEGIADRLLRTMKLEGTTEYRPA